MSGIVGSKFNIRGSGLVASYGTDGQHMLSAGAGKSNVFETVAGGGGKVGQVVQGELLTRYTSTTNDTWLSPGLSVAITPAATSSKIWINVQLGCIGGSSQSESIGMRIDRTISGGATTYVGRGDQGSHSTVGWRGWSLGEEFSAGNDDKLGYSASTAYLDSPSTTSATTYKLEMVNASTGGFALNGVSNTGVSNEYPTTASFITAWEILA